ncbi:hypothetical protein BDP27DRAFT_1328299 [Rhodocollybia butyracea]|uniref:Uncharacterized protein n=1 Tax=Rhodocollybia butyracea TaxID=206335 RepID=A0A9P5PL01_9AGAR|nr:hypothetical protein BDP27DRAFT_1328299 [Rhodocollybia butyracea]
MTIAIFSHLEEVQVQPRFTDTFVALFRDCDFAFSCPGTEMRQTRWNGNPYSRWLRRCLDSTTVLT